jgi:hypothetical protein
MLVKHLQSYIYKELRFKAIILSAFIAIMAVLVIYNQTAVSNQDKVEQEAKKLQNDLSSIKKSISDSEISLKMWDTGIKGILKDRSGIKIKVASKLLEQLKTTYKIKELTINLSNPEERTDIIPTKFSKIVYTNGTMTFKAYTDIYVYKFVQGMIDQLPGFIQIKSLTLTTETSTDLIADITSGKLDTLVKAKLEFIWQDLQDIQEGDAVKPKEAVKPGNQKNSIVIK